MNDKLNALSKYQEIEKRVHKLKVEGNSRLARSLVLEAINPDTFKHGKASGCVMLKGTEEASSYNVYKLYKAKFPQDFVIRITDGEGSRSFHDLEEFKDLPNISLLDPRS